MKTLTLGGDRLGSGNKQKVQLHGFERSTHDLGYVWRNTQSPGTLVPFMCQLALPGDTFDINLGADVKTHPTVGPLFASFKLQLDIFECPIRLYHSWLHNNKLKIGNNIETVKLPLLEWSDINNVCDDVSSWYSLRTPDTQQFNSSSLFNYLGNKGIGKKSATLDPVKGYRNAVPYLCYFDIFKNYYANKQEPNAYIIHQKDHSKNLPAVKFTYNGSVVHNGPSCHIMYEYNSALPLTIEFDIYTDIEPDGFGVYYVIENTRQFINYIVGSITTSPISGGWHCTGIFDPGEDCVISGVGTKELNNLNISSSDVSLTAFPLVNIDTMRENILRHDNANPFIINDASVSPYNLPFKNLDHPQSAFHTCSFGTQEGLLIKTYQSDIFNNWLNTEWITGSGGINEITAVDTSGGSFNIDTLNLANKVYKMLTRIATSGGSYDDWLEAVYDHEPYKKAETPIYMGGLSKEIIFQEVVSTNLDDSSAPLGSLAGRGTMSSKHKGGQVYIKVNEPSYIIGIVSITPRIDYYQGNDFFTHHKTLNDLHKPSLDEIGFQDLITDKMAWWDTEIVNDEPVFKSAGKQPAWIDYMTNFNRLHGNFALEDNEMFMTLARRYDFDTGTKAIGDLTTYIDPAKFNYAFAQTDLGAMNFWVQIGCDITARRKMSAKVMPNL